MDRDKILKMVIVLALIVVFAYSLSSFLKRDSMSLSEYARLNGLPMETPGTAALQSPIPDDSDSSEDAADSGSGQPSLSPDITTLPPSSDPVLESSYETSLEIPGNPEPPVGASLNGSSQAELRVLLEDGFYYEPLSDNLCRYMTGVSYPSASDDGEQPLITFDDLRYVHILHYDFEGNPREGELICNESIAQDLVEIFHELYRNEYQLEKVQLIDIYDGDDEASMSDNNTSCFNYRTVDGSSSLSKHALGLAIDINPLYNPYITYNADGTEAVAPASASTYSDRSLSFPYKIDENDLCYKLFTQHGFTWGGNWNNVKDYQHFQKAN